MRGKSIILTTALTLMLLSMTACGNESVNTASAATTEAVTASSEEIVATPEPTPEVTAEPEVTATPEPTVEPTEEPVPEVTATPEPVETTPEVSYTYSDMSATMYAKQSVNVRNLPSTDGEKLGGLNLNDKVTVTGKCNETGWLRIDYNGQVGYASNNYFSNEKIVIQTANNNPAPTTPNQPNQPNETAPNPETNTPATDNGGSNDNGGGQAADSGNQGGSDNEELRKPYDYEYITEIPWVPNEEDTRYDPSDEEKAELEEIEKELDDYHNSHPFEE